MSKFAKYSTVCISVVAAILALSSCNNFFNPKQEIKPTQNELFDDWYEYRSADMALYGLQQRLVEQLVVLGELRADMLTVTPNADADLVAVNDFQFSKDNKYVSPTNFFLLINSCNNFIHILETKHPEVLDPASPVSNYDRLYGEAVCMRAWAYFNAVRIYGKVPFIPESLVTMDEINNFVNTDGTYVDSVYIDYGLDGYHNIDTIYNKPVTLHKQLMDINAVIDKFVPQLENLKAIGVNYAIDNNDATWEITTWSTWSWHALLGQLYLYRGNLAKAEYHFHQIMYNSSSGNRYEITNAFANNNWKNIFSTIDNREDIYVLWFNKNYFQENSFQDLFETRDPHKYMLKPTRQAVMEFETDWNNWSVSVNGTDYAHAKIQNRGRPGDQYRGWTASYRYIKGGNYDDYLANSDVTLMLNYKALGDDRSVQAIMDGYDTVVYKYSINKTTFQQDEGFIVYRAASIHLYEAEIYIYYAFYDPGAKIVRTYTGNALNIVNDGSNYSVLSNRPQVGVRGRVGLNSITLPNIVYDRDPFTNEVTGYRDFTGNLPAKQRYLDKAILDERAKELAFEGERFYDLMRAAKRFGPVDGPTFLANKISAKYPAGQREQMRQFLMDPNNWYIHIFE